jgi:hypothetical protein
MERSKRSGSVELELCSPINTVQRPLTRPGILSGPKALLASRCRGGDGGAEKVSAGGRGWRYIAATTGTSMITPRHTALRRVGINDCADR